MLDIKFIREYTDLVKENCHHRHVKINVDRILELDEERRDFMQQIEALRAERNEGSKGKPSDDDIVHMRELGEKITQFEDRLIEINDEYTTLLLQVPNMTHPETPIGGEEDFKVLETKGEKPSFDFTAKDHETLMTERDLIDFEAGAKVAGSKFYFVKNDAVRLNQALLNYGMDVATTHGYTLMETPDLAKNEILSGAGFNPRGEESNIYNIEETDMSLVGTAEIPMLGYHADEVLDLSDGPKKYAALSHCFRTEAGNYGRTNKGLYRVHQFTKLEMFVFCKPEDSEKLHQEILDIEKEICDGLEIPYRVIDIASGDLGAPAYRKYDIEGYMTMIEDYGEITSASNCMNYQARRLNIKYKNDADKKDFVHTLNGTAVVLSRFPIAVIENHQQEDGSIMIPKVLQGYMGKERI